MVTRRNAPDADRVELTPGVFVPAELDGIFPDPDTADENGIVCAGARPLPELLKVAYCRGIFPWPHRGLPLLWFSPDPRFVLPMYAAHLPRSLRKALRKSSLRVTADTAFAAVIARCSSAARPDQQSTWITRDMQAGYTALHAEGYAHSVEAWDGDTLVGGLYGVSLGGVFFGESMFAAQDDAAKIAFATLLCNLDAWGFAVVDCQSHTDNLERFGALHWPRPHFLATLATQLHSATRQGPWTLALGPKDAAGWEPTGPGAVRAASLPSVPADVDTGAPDPPPPRAPGDAG